MEKEGKDIKENEDNKKANQSKKNKEKDEDTLKDGQRSELDEAIKRHNKELRRLKEQLREQEEIIEIAKALEKANQAKEAKIEELSKLIERERAEFQNYRKRTEGEKKLMRDEGQGLAASKMASVLDVVYNAINMIPDPNVAKGVMMIADKMESVLLSLGVEEINAIGQHFDPELHDALMRTQVEDPNQDGIVLEVFQKGYKLGNNVLRYSQVRVGTK